MRHRRGVPTPRVGLVAILVVAAGLRLYLAAASAIPTDADEAATGLMVRSILDGRAQYVYFVGQEYNGALEQYLQAALYALTPLPQNPFTLRLVQVGLGVVTTAAVYLLGRIVTGRPWCGLVAAGVFATGPYWLLWLGTRSYGAYDSTQLAVVVALVLALRASGHARDDVRLTNRGRTAALGGFGFCCGLCVWLGLSAFEVLLPAAFWLLPTVVRTARGAVAAGAGLVVGALPVLFWVVSHGAIPGTGGVQPATSIADRLVLLWNDVGPEFLGLSGANGADGVPTVMRHAAMVLAVGLLVLGLGVRARAMLAVVTLRREPRAAGDLVLFVLPVAAVLYLLSSHAWYFGNPRYLFVLYPLLAVAVAMLAARVAGLARARGWVSAEPLPATWRQRPVAVAAVALVVLTTSTLTFEPRLPRAVDYASDAALARAVDYLADHGVTDVYALYWVALPMAYLAGDSGVTVAPWGTGAEKVPAERAAVDAAPTFVYVDARRIRTLQDPTLQERLDSHGVSYVPVHVGPVTIFTELSPPLRPEQLGLPG